MDFKVGDRVKVVGGGRLDGEMGTVIDASSPAPYVKMDVGGAYSFMPDYLATKPRLHVYIFGSENAAEVFRMTVDAILGYAPERTGSALVMSSADYDEICDKTYAVHAAIVAEVKR